NGLVLLAAALVLLIVLLRTIKIVPQKQVKIIERLGKYHRTAEAGLNTIVPFLDADRHTIDLRDQLTKHQPPALTTSDNVPSELKNITPPEEIRLTMEKQMTAERTRRAVVTTAEGEKSSAILRAEGQKQSQIVNAEGAKQAAILAAEGQAEARLRVAQAEAQ